jgi:hypothetical protein
VCVRALSFSLHSSLFIDNSQLFVTEPGL